jgi:hypothetical protein
MSEIQQRIAALETQLADLKAQVGGEPTEVLASRRDFAKKAALGVAGLAAAGVAGSVVGAGSASASTGETLLLGENQFAANMTYIANGSSAVQTVGNPLTSEPTMWWVDNRSSTIEANGIRGDGHGVTGIGLWGHSDFGGIGVQGDGGVGVKASGTRSALLLTGSGIAPSTRVDAHTVGEIDIDASGNVYLCVANGTPGTWRKLGGPSSAGQLHLTTPGRVYDSRDADGKLAFGSPDRVVTANVVAAGHVGAGNIVVPAGATAILCNLTVTATEGAGFLGLYSNALASWPGTSSINWVVKDTDTANTLTTAVDATGKLKVTIGGQGVATKTHFVIDVVGYYI